MCVAAATLILKLKSLNARKAISGVMKMRTVKCTTENTGLENAGHGMKIISSTSTHA